MFCEVAAIAAIEANRQGKPMTVEEWEVYLRSLDEIEHQQTE